MKQKTVEELSADIDRLVSEYTKLTFSLRKDYTKESIAMVLTTALADHIAFHCDDEKQLVEGVNWCMEMFTGMVPGIWRDYQAKKKMN